MHATPNNQNTQNAQGSQNTAVKDIPAARAENMSKIYGAGDTKVVALDNVTVEFAPGEFTAIMGPSGSGKSTLMHCMAGLDTPTNGAAYLGTTDISQLGDKALTKLRRDRLGFIFQSFNLVPTLTAAENITRADRRRRRQGRQGLVRRDDRPVGALPTASVTGPPNSPAASNSAWHAPAPWWQRPEIIVGDEPTGNLDSNSSAEVLAILRAAVDRDHQTVVIVTHDARAAAYADRVIFLADGQVVSELRQPDVEQILTTMTSIEGL